MKNEKVCTLSILIPAYNEEKTIYQLLEKVKDVSLIKDMKKEIIVTDDCSKDQTAQKVDDFIKNYPEIHLKYIKHDRNSGKGYAIRTALKEATGDFVIIQDADLEYDPEDYNVLLTPMLTEKLKVIYGSRFLNKNNKHSYQSFYIGGRIVTLLTNILFGQNLTDEPTCYKLFETSFLKSIPLQCKGFEFCPEVTAKTAKRGIKIKEIPISYYPRSLQEGKKIKWTDGLEAIWILIRYRFKK